MFHPIGLTAVLPTAKQFAVVASGMNQGQWAYLSGTNTTWNEPEVTPVAGYGAAQSAKAILTPIIKEPANSEELLIIDDLIVAGARVTRLVGSDLIIEDTELDNRAAGDFSSATPGDSMVLNTDGYPTLDGATDDPGAAATVVAYFERTEGNSVWYRTA